MPAPYEDQRDPVAHGRGTAQRYALGQRRKSAEIRTSEDVAALVGEFSASHVLRKYADERRAFERAFLDELGTLGLAPAEASR